MNKDNLVILAQDPSFAKLSFSLYDGKDTIHIDSCSFELGECVGFEKIFNANRDIMRQYIEKLTKSYGVNTKLFINKIFSEIPPPTGIYSAGLFSLDTFVLDKLFAMNKQCDEIFTLPPSFLMTIHNTRDYKKSESVVLAHYMMDDILKSKFKFVKPRNKLNADQAESLIFLIKALYKYDIKGTREEIARAISGFMSETEKLLISRTVTQN